MSKNKKRAAQLIVGLAISAGCMYFAFKGLSPGAVMAALRQAHLSWIGIALVVYSFGFAFRTLRWKGLLEPVHAVEAPQLLGPLIIGFFANNILPFRMGEFVRAHVTGEKFQITMTASLASIVIERIFDTISFLTIFLGVALLFPFPPAVKHAAFIMAIACAGLIVTLVLASTHQEKAHQILRRLPMPERWKAKLEQIIRNFAHGVSGMTQVPYVARALCLSLIIWAIEGSTIYLIAHAFPEAHVTYPMAYFLLFFIGLSVTIPQAPGYVGTVELFGVTALSLLKVPKDLGLPIVLTIHGTQFTFIALVGLWALHKEGRLWKEFTGAIKDAK